MFGRALSWGSAFAVCIVHCSLVYQFEHSGKVRRAWFKFGFENFYSSLLSGSASFLCAALMSPQRTKQYCPQIEYIYVYIFRSLTSCLVEHSLGLGVVPSLFALCIAHWFTSLSTLARYDEPGLNLALRIFILHCYQVRPHSSVLRL